jgi:UDP-N-acetyl-D-glucosamine dehydrogenase
VGASCPPHRVRLTPDADFQGDASFMSVQAPTPPAAVLSPAAEAKREKVRNRTAVIGIVGLGYVGLPLALEFFKAGFPVVGLDIDPEKVELLNAGKSYLHHIGSDRIAKMAGSGKFRATASMADASGCDVLILCVPTPLNKNREPDLSPVVDTCKGLAPHVTRGTLVSFESTTYPGTTREVVIPLIEEGSGLSHAAGDFFVSYSPEREDPANPSFSTSTIPKVVGGATPDALGIALEVYNAVVVNTVPVSSCDVAEAAKLVENIFRCVNIAMVNELKVVFQRMDIDVWEVIEAAKTKPFGFMPFYPGPGLGGHCIPIDPFYLTWRARQFDTTTKFIELAGEVNTEMPEYVVTRTMEALNDQGKAMKGSRILIIGLAYKNDVDDMRMSPTLKLIELLERRGAIVEYHDPYIPAVKPNRDHPEFTGRESQPLERAAACDVTLIATAHKVVDYARLGELARVIVDCRNVMTTVAAPKAVIYKA